MFRGENGSEREGDRRGGIDCKTANEQEEEAGNLEVWTGWFLGNNEGFKITQAGIIEHEPFCVWMQDV